MKTIDGKNPDAGGGGGSHQSINDGLFEDAERWDVNLLCEKLHKRLQEWAL